MIPRATLAAPTIAAAPPVARARNCRREIPSPLKARRGTSSTASESATTATNAIQGIVTQLSVLDSDGAHSRLDVVIGIDSHIAMIAIVASRRQRSGRAVEFTSR